MTATENQDRFETSPAANELRVREIWNEAELEQIFRIRDEVFVDEQHLTDDARNDPDDANSFHYLAYLGDQPIGTGRMTMFGREAQVAWVAVRKPHRGNGIGKAIMEAIIARARSEQAGYLLLNAQTHALGFYEQLGFERVGSEFYMGGIGHYVMILRF